MRPLEKTILMLIACILVSLIVLIWQKIIYG